MDPDDGPAAFFSPPVRLLARPPSADVTLPTTCCTGSPEPPGDEVLVPVAPGTNLPPVVMLNGLADKLADKGVVDKGLGELVENSQIWPRVTPRSGAGHREPANLPGVHPGERCGPTRQSCLPLLLCSTVRKASSLGPSLDRS